MKHYVNRLLIFLGLREKLSAEDLGITEKEFEYLKSQIPISSSPNEFKRIV